MVIHFAKQKNEALSFFQRTVKLIKRETANQVTKLWTDRGSEFCNTSFEAFLADNAIAHELSTNYTPQQNGFVERDNRTIMEMAKSLLHAKGLPKILWAKAVHTAVHILNRTINLQLQNKTPYEC
jgi:transposase InsO family protein